MPWAGLSGPGNLVSLQCHHLKSLCVLVLENNLVASEPLLLVVLGLMLHGGVWRDGGASM